MAHLWSVCRYLQGCLFGKMVMGVTGWVSLCNRNHSKTVSVGRGTVCRLPDFVVMS